ncbi:MAG TPA: F0F1 ATP synthase subunit C [Stenotrophobium sp.]|nr:F0F1 ATP synthase subunit C [Stenotrophobium sp.]
MIYAYTATGVGIILGLAGLGSALGWGLICSRFIEGIARQPELRAQLTGQMLFVGGLMEAFPFIVLGISMWFTFANPFLSGALAAIKPAVGG